MNQNQENQVAIPQHVAIIMDGNGRWAEKQGLARKEGHKAGAEAIRPIITKLGEKGVKCLSLFGFSTENWGRPRPEIDAIFGIGGQFIDEYLDELNSKNIKLQHLGNLDSLPNWLAKKVEKAVLETSTNDLMTVNLAFNYGARTEILDAVKNLIADGINPEDIKEELFEEYLQTAGLPDVDFLIRTGGTERFSNFLMWQSTYAEIYFSKLYWPDFGESEIEVALHEFSVRQRKFGLVPDTVIK